MSDIGILIEKLQQLSALDQFLFGPACRDAAAALQRQHGDIRESDTYHELLAENEILHADLAACRKLDEEPYWSMAKYAGSVLCAINRNGKYVRATAPTFLAAFNAALTKKL